MPITSSRRIVPGIQWRNYRFKNQESRAKNQDKKEKAGFNPAFFMRYNLDSWLLALDSGLLNLFPYRLYQISI